MDRGLNLVGADVVEVASLFTAAGVTALAGVTILFELVCVLADAVERRRRAERSPLCTSADRDIDSGFGNARSGNLFVVANQYCRFIRRKNQTMV